jgi:hypothetical protein
MALKFDVTLKETVKEDIAGYAARFGLGSGRPTSLLNVELSTLSMATDAAIGAGDPLEEIADLNFQSGPDPRLEDRILLYNSALRFRYGAPVRSIVILLRPKADTANLTGLLTYGDAKHRLEFQYEVIRVWQEPAETFLNGSIGLAPLAMLGEAPDDRPAEDVARDIFQRIENRLLAELPRDRAVVLIQAAALLAGLKFESDGLARIFQGVGLMSETTTFEYFTRLGEIRGRQKTLIELVRIKFDCVDEVAEATLRSIADLDRLERMTKAIFAVKNWQELLDTP